MIQPMATVLEFPELGIGPFQVDRFLVEDLFGKIDIAWYGVIICFAMILAIAVILYNATRREGFGTDSFIDYFLITIPLGIIGARAMYVLANLEYYDTFPEAIAIWEGGLAIYGGVLTGIVVIPIIAKFKKNHPLKVFDAIAPGVLLAQSIGRWGNFINAEAYGTRTDLVWGMKIDGGRPVHPTFLYESVITFTGFLIAMFLLYRFKKFDGEILCFYLVWYGIGRTLVEGLRTDSLMIGPYRLAQCIGIFTALAGIALAVILILFQKNPPLTEKAADAPAPESETAGETALDAAEAAVEEKAEHPIAQENEKEGKEE